MSRSVVVGTRGSALAVAQAEAMVQFLRDAGFEVEWRRFTTSGDQWLAGPLDKRVGTGFFTKELEDGLLAGDLDLLIHSLKDVALDRPEGIVPACVPKREDPRDLLLLNAAGAEALRAGGPLTIGTSAVRRERMLRRAFPGAAFTWIRGNVPTRVQRVREGALRDAPLAGTVLAAAGLRRLELDLSDLVVRPLGYGELLPAPGQGALYAEARSGRADLVEALQGFHDPMTERCVRLERAVLAGIGGGCQQPLGALAEPGEDGTIRLRAAYALEDGVRTADVGGADDGTLVAEALKALGLA